MQDEINSRVVALSIRLGAAGARLTAHALKEAMQKYLAENERAKLQKAQKAPADKTRHGKQTVGQLMEQNTGLTNIEITDQNIKSFERIARKYNIDFALKKDKAASPPRYLVFFKARDVDVMNLQWLHTIISNAKASILGTYHGLPKKNLQDYLDEFSFRFSRRGFGGALFDRLALAMVGSPLA